MIIAKYLNSVILSAYLSIGLFSCSSSDDCVSKNCNFGSFNHITCECNCDSGVLGEFCERFDSTKIQELLDAGVSPFTLYSTNISLDSLYGKVFLGGLIFYIDSSKKLGLLASLDNITIPTTWGCFQTDILNIPNVLNYNSNDPQPGSRIGDGKNNTDELIKLCNMSNIAAKLCRDLGQNWYLPSMTELFTMYQNLKLKGHGFFYNGLYWSSTERDQNQAWLQNFNGIDHVKAVKSSNNNVRAVRNF